MAAAPGTHLACGTSGLLPAAAPAATVSLHPCHLQGDGTELPDHRSQGPAWKQVQQELKGWGRGRSPTILHHSHLLFLWWGQTGLCHLQRPAQHPERPAVARTFSSWPSLLSPVLPQTCTHGGSSGQSSYLGSCLDTLQENTTEVSSFSFSLPLASFPDQLLSLVQANAAPGE